jgi:hypothetical protein
MFFKAYFVMIGFKIHVFLKFQNHGMISLNNNKILWVLFTAVWFISCKHNKGDYTTIDNKESCLSCHSEMTGFSTYHNPQSIGCAACHLGNIKSLEKDEAHKGMILIPGNLQNVDLTCGTTQCHASEVDRVKKSLMTTNSGLVSVNKLLFDEIHHTDTLFHISHIGHSAAETHLRNLCFNCHLDKEKTHYAAVDEMSRGGGCLACHLNYEEQHKPDVNDHYHPQINLQVDNMKCFGCHSRSGRISTNYEGWYEINLFQDKIAQEFRDKYINEKIPKGSYSKSIYETISSESGERKLRLLQDGRVFGYAGSDVHHDAGLQCIDCHSSHEVMGDGKLYKRESQAIIIQCIDCHTEGEHRKKSINELDEIAIIDYALRGYKHSENGFIATQKNAIPLVNTSFDTLGNAFLISKISGKKHPVSPSCERDAVHDRLACSTCHTSWAPSCIGCHTDYDPRLTSEKNPEGRWVEHVAEFSHDYPVMGIKKTDKGEEIVPTIPGMIMSLDKGNFTGDKKGDKEKFVRWFAPNAAHTTTKQVRDCKSCHLNSHALGYGKGNLTVETEGKKVKWNFIPYYALAEQDKLPQDAWIGFLSHRDPNKRYSSHDDLVPLDYMTQSKILEVGACLSCHEEDKLFIDKMLQDGQYQKMYKTKSEKCIIPYQNNNH